MHAPARARRLRGRFPDFQDAAAAQPHHCATRHFHLSVAPNPAEGQEFPLIEQGRPVGRLQISISSGYCQGSVLIWREKELETSPWSRPLVKDSAQSLAVKTKTKSVFLCKKAHLCFSVFLVYRAEAFQLILVNSTVSRFAKAQFALDSTREHFHIDPQWFGANDVGQAAPFLSMLICQ